MQRGRAEYLSIPSARSILQLHSKSLARGVCNLQTAAHVWTDPSRGMCALATACLYNTHTNQNDFLSFSLRSAAKTVTTRRDVKNPLIGAAYATGRPGIKWTVITCVSSAITHYHYSIVRERTSTRLRFAVYNMTHPTRCPVQVRVARANPRGRKWNFLRRSFAAKEISSEPRKSLLRCDTDETIRTMIIRR